ncbi:hypothetical protein, partial [Pseudomonas aeruginosa]|uniref:hypothetical protein n=3 Tax=Pseudomonas aeruginosa TaxID=287 RepID=UPI001C3EEF08
PQPFPPFPPFPVRIRFFSFTFTHTSQVLLLLSGIARPGNRVFGPFPFFEPSICGAMSFAARLA